MCWGITAATGNFSLQSLLQREEQRALSSDHRGGCFSLLIQPLTVRRLEHEKRRKEIKEQWHRAQRKLVSSSHAARAGFALPAPSLEYPRDMYPSGDAGLLAPLQ